MKKFTRSIIAVFAIATTLVSCSKDDNGDPMQGKWTLDNFVVMVPGTGAIPYDIDGDCPEKNYFDLKTAGKLEQGAVDPENCEFSKIDGTWKKNNNSLELTTAEDGTVSLDITSATANKLVLKLTKVGDEELPAGAYAELTLSKK